MISIVKIPLSFFLQGYVKRIKRFIHIAYFLKIYEVDDMIWIFHQIILGLHILLAIFWVGGLSFIGWGVFPAIRHLKYVEQRDLLLAIMKWAHPLFTIAGLGVIFTGVLLGTVLGPIDHWNDIWNTRFGSLWLTAFIVASLSLAWGALIGYKQMEKVLNNKLLWIEADQGMKENLYRALLKLFLIESVEPLGFAVLIAIMVLF